MKNLGSITEARDVATKGYVDSKVADTKVDLPNISDENVLTWQDTIEPKAEIGLGIQNATVGDIIKVKAVDDNGTPTAWESAAMPDNEENWELIRDITLTEETAGVGEIIIDKDSNGNDFSLRKINMILWNVGDTSNTGTANNAVAFNHSEALLYNNIAVNIAGMCAAGSTTGGILNASLEGFWNVNYIPNKIVNSGNSLSVNKGGLTLPTNEGITDCLKYNEPAYKIRWGRRTSTLTFGAGTRMIVYGVRA
mgnify:CR=1 FL=1